MKKTNTTRAVLVIVILFVISRIVVRYFGVQMDIRALSSYWQYLDVETLKHNLLRGVWYDHAQPPVFNLLLGSILKLSGEYAPAVFELFFKLVTLANTLLIFFILRRLTNHVYVSLFLSCLYLLSPATLIYECELFYTIFISLLLLISVYSLLCFQQNESWISSGGIFIPLVAICLTRSMYHLVWLIFLSFIILFYYRKKNGFRKLFMGSAIAVLLVTSWYIKNYVIFGVFSSSSWIGMNVARNVFHDNPIRDSSRIEAFEPFSKVSVYKPFLPENYEKPFVGLNDRDLLQETKNDSFINENHIAYIEISKKYMEASKAYLKAHPFTYLQNVIQSSIIFFAPATRYPLAEDQAAKIKYYDIMYSFNLSHFAKGKQQRRIALTLSAIPKFLIYISVFYLLVSTAIKSRKMNLPNITIIITIAFVFLVSSLLEHYENMRFRYEIEPLFLLLAGQVLTIIREKRMEHKAHEA